MSLSPGVSSEEIKGYVWEYLDLPQGSKEGWLEGKPFTRAQFHRWRKAFVSGDMERGLVPRSSSRVSDMTKRAFDLFSFSRRYLCLEAVRRKVCEVRPIFGHCLSDQLSPLAQSRDR